MAEATYKAPAIDEFLTSFFGADRQATIATQSCVTCNGKADTFSHELSKRAYSISGMCQACQDSVFS